MSLNGKTGASMRLIAILCAVALAGCAASVDRIQTGDGRTGYNIECGGSAYSWAKCYKAATKACPTGYDVLSRDGSTTQTNYGPAVDRSMVVACK
ncbi:hypothetical protein [Paraburkholderia terrae]|uniref:hypothetical protein n=1 Tax=Paraburkholderia terrae TaxID=311230 RepID=UPI001EE1B546|nr:hypothetical protein [Paraburkholderia terrae]GJH00266.1 hypothetical protein CBA19C8_06935 [Paraburkholderia terrae]